MDSAAETSELKVVGDRKFTLRGTTLMLTH